MIKYAECPVCEQPIKNTNPHYTNKVPVIMQHVRAEHRKVAEFIVERDQVLIGEGRLWEKGEHLDDETT